MTPQSILVKHTHTHTQEESVHIFEIGKIFPDLRSSKQESRKMYGFSSLGKRTEKVLLKENISR